MGGNMKDRWSVPVTAVANEFIDTYMAAANGEYVKVYLYVLRHQWEDITIDLIADALNHTESDVRRALSYWKKAGVLADSEQEQRVQGEPVRPESGGRTFTREQDREQAAVPDLEVDAFQRKNGTSGRADDRGLTGIREQAGVRERTETAGQEDGCIPVYSTEQVNRLAQDEEFSQLLYIAQKYMNKVFTPRDCQVFAYLYEGLSMSSELLEYLVEYCVQNGHISVRYMETVAMSWHEKGIRTALEAKDYSASYSRDSFAVMKAFGINSRKPAAPEQKLMDKWFRDYGFSREVVLEACSRTITAIHNPSFQYADRILSDWKDAGVRTMSDITALDKIRKEQEQAKSKKSGRGTGEGQAAARSGPARSGNRFHNLEEHGYDYDEMVWDMINAGQKGE